MVFTSFFCEIVRFDLLVWVLEEIIPKGDLELKGAEYDKNEKRR